MKLARQLMLALPIGLLVCCATLLWDTLVAVLDCKSASLVTQFLLLGAPYWWAGVCAGIITVALMVQQRATTHNAQLSIVALLLSIVIWIGRELLEWNFVPIESWKEQPSLERVVGSCTLIAVVASGKLYSIAREFLRRRFIEW